MKIPANATLLGLLTCLAVLGVIVLSFTGHPLPEVLPALAIAGLSALAGLSIPGPVPAPTVLYAPPTATLSTDPTWTRPVTSAVPASSSSGSHSAIPGMSPVAADLANGA